MLRGRLDGFHCPGDRAVRRAPRPRRSARACRRHGARRIAGRRAAGADIQRRLRRGIRLANGLLVGFCPDARPRDRDPRGAAVQPAVGVALVGEADAVGRRPGPRAHGAARGSAHRRTSVFLFRRAVDDAGVSAADAAVPLRHEHGGNVWPARRRERGLSAARRPLDRSEGHHTHGSRRDHHDADWLRDAACVWPHAGRARRRHRARGHRRGPRAPASTRSIWWRSSPAERSVRTSARLASASAAGPGSARFPSPCCCLRSSTSRAWIGTEYPQTRG